jgi:type I restriction enzyme M protein
MGIVLPDGILTNSSLQYVRDFINEKAQLLGVVSLPQTAFKRPASKGSGDSGSGVKASLLFLTKRKEAEKSSEDYPIFMAASKKSGKDNSGEYIFLNEKGRRIKSEGGIFETAGKLSLDDDLDEIAEAFIKFAKKEKFEWRNK